MNTLPITKEEIQRVKDSLESLKDYKFDYKKYFKKEIQTYCRVPLGYKGNRDTYIRDHQKQEEVEVLDFSKFSKEYFLHYKPNLYLNGTIIYLKALDFGLSEREDYLYVLWFNGDYKFKD